MKRTEVVDTTFEKLLLPVSQTFFGQISYIEANASILCLLDVKVKQVDLTDSKTDPIVK